MAKNLVGIRASTAIVAELIPDVKHQSGGVTAIWNRGRKVSQLDSTDVKILRMLQSEGRIPITQLSAHLDVPHATIRDRIRKLESEGVIEGYQAVINPAQVGLPITGFVQITLDHRLQTSLQQTIDTLMNIQEVSEFYVLTGETDIFVRIHATGMDHLREIIFEKLNRIPGFQRSNTGVVLASGRKCLALRDDR
jgi:DNA-binding Lrp family transcriptional regulator